MEVDIFGLDVTVTLGVFASRLSIRMEKVVSFVTYSYNDIVLTRSCLCVLNSLSVFSLFMFRS